MGLFTPPCVHDPFMMDKTILPSPYEQLSDEIKSNAEAVHNLAHLLEDSALFFQKILVVTLSCKKCGKVWSEETSLFVQ